MSIMEQARSYLEQVKALVGDVHKEARKKLYEALPISVRREAKRITVASYFVPENAQLDKRVEHLSPSGAYKLIVTPHKTLPGSWEYSQGLVYRKDDDKPIAEVQRNYRSFPYAWVEGHEKGDFLLCGEDYQGQTVINLQTAARRDHLPSTASLGAGFCWACIHPSPNKKLLCVEGCFWGAPYELRFYDFSEPMLPPWPDISRTETPLSDFFEWVGDESAKIGGYENYYEPLNLTEDEMYRAKREGKMTEDEYERYRDDDEKWKDRKVHERIWTRPPALQSLADYVDDTFKWIRERGIKPHRESLLNARVLLGRLSPEDLETYLKSPTCELLEWAEQNQEAA